jgi:parallel beta-helix repeat protein
LKQIEIRKKKKYIHLIKNLIQLIELIIEEVNLLNLCFSKVIYLCFILLFAFNLPETIETSKIASIQDVYINHDPFYIDGNDEIDNFTSKGNGTRINPYIIENYNITPVNIMGIGINLRNIAKFIIIRNITIYNLQFEGISLENVSNVKVENCSISQNLRGIFEYNSYNNSFINNRIENNGYEGILMISSSENFLSNNIIISKSNTTNGINLQGSKNNTILNNRMVNSGLQIYAYNLQDLKQNRVEDNTLNSNPIVFLQDLNNETFSDSISQFILINCSLIQITNQIIPNTSNVLRIFFSRNITINSNIFEGSNVDNGVFVFKSEFIFIKNNLIKGFNSGIYLSKTINSTVEDNFLTDNINGLFLSDSNKNLISNNTITNNKLQGLIFEYSEINIVTLNSFNNNSFYGISLLNSFYNIIYLNSFISNGGEKSQAYATSNLNSWSFNSIGNYWNDYKGKDSNNDNVGEDSYFIDGPDIIIDRYPLIIFKIDTIYQDTPIITKTTFIPLETPDDSNNLFQNSDFYSLIVIGSLNFVIFFSLIIFIDYRRYNKSRFAHKKLSYKNYLVRKIQDKRSKKELIKSKPEKHEKLSQETLDIIDEIIKENLDS